MWSGARRSTSERLTASWSTPARSSRATTCCPPSRPTLSTAAATRSSPRSWGRSSEGGPIEDLDEPPRDDVFEIVTRPEDAPGEPEMVQVEFEKGCPVALNGTRLGLVELLERAGQIGSRHGVGIVDHIEDRIVGLKVRDLYEVPAAEIILTAH